MVATSPFSLLPAYPPTRLPASPEGVPMSNIGSYMLRRVLLLVPLLLGLSIVMFGLIHLAPGDPALAFISEQNASSDFLEPPRKNMGPQKPLPVQYLIWLGNLVRGDLGPPYTFNRKPVADL